MLLLLVTLFSFASAAVEISGLTFSSAAVSGTLTLRASLITPSTPAPWPGAVIFHGSGVDIDRYGTQSQKSLFGWQLFPRPATLCSFVTAVGPYQLYNQLARWLADTHGVATLIYDKRGCTVSPCAYLRCNATVTTNCFNLANIGLDDLITDAVSATSFLRGRTDIRASDVTIIGHSQGCTVASTVANRVPVKRVIRLMGVGTDFFTFSYRQFAANLQTDLATQVARDEPCCFACVSRRLHRATVISLCPRRRWCATLS